MEWRLEQYWLVHHPKFDAKHEELNDEGNLHQYSCLQRNLCFKNKVLIYANNFINFADGNMYAHILISLALCDKSPRFDNLTRSKIGGSNLCGYEGMCKANVLVEEINVPR